MYSVYHDMTTNKVQCKARPSLNNLRLGLALVQRSIGGAAVLAENQTVHKLEYLCRLVCKFAYNSHPLHMRIDVKLPSATLLSSPFL